jgi:hypothetical protein
MSIINKAPLEAHLEDVAIEKHIFIDIDLISARTSLQGNALLSHPCC